MDVTMLLTGAGLGASAMAVPAAALSYQVRRLLTERADLRRVADVDGLTGLLNRQGFYARAGRLVARRRRPAVVVLVDLDNFKDVNDKYGHGVGDLVLREFARRLRERVGTDGLVARLGGDEFVAVVALRDDESVQDLGSALADVSDAPIELDDIEISMTVSVGLAPVTGPVNLAVLLGRADAAMFRAKRDRASTVVFDPALDGQVTPIEGLRPARELVIDVTIELGVAA